MSNNSLNSSIIFDSSGLGDPPGTIFDNNTPVNVSYNTIGAVAGINGTASYALTASYAMNGGGGGSSSLAVVGGATVNGVTTLTFIGASVTGTTPNATVTITGSLSASYAASSSVSVSSSFASNGGVTQLLAGPNITLSPTNGLGQVTVSATLSGSGTFNTATGSYGSFYSTLTQTASAVSTPTSMSFNVTDLTNGVSISGSNNTRITVANAGVYDIQFSAQLARAVGSGTEDVYIWLRKNGTNLTYTNTDVTFAGGTNVKQVAAWNWFVNAASNDYYEIVWSTTSTNIILQADNTTTPAVPSIILTVNRVDQFLSNTGSFSGSFVGSFTGQLTGTASYASNALTSSYALTSSVAISASYARSSSVAVSSSYANLSSVAVSASYALSSSVTVSSSYTVSASYSLSSSVAVSASYVALSSVAISASYALSSSVAVSASYARSSSVAISSSYAASSSIAVKALTSLEAVSASYALKATDADTAAYATNAGTAGSAGSANLVNISDNPFDTNPQYITFVNNSSSGFTGLNIDSDSLTYIPNTNTIYATASYALLAATASYVKLVESAATASYVLNAVSASYARSSSLAVSASYAINAGNATTADTSTNANNIKIVDNSGDPLPSYITFVSATSSFNSLFVDSNSLTYIPNTNTIYATASYTISASYVQSSSYAEIATNADYAAIANYAANAGTAATASYVLNAVSASYALKATSADNINSGASTKLAYYPSAGTIIDDATNLEYDGSGNLIVSNTGQIGFSTTPGLIYFGTFGSPSFGRAGFSVPGQSVMVIDYSTARAGFGGGTSLITSAPDGLVEIKGKADEIQLLVKANGTQTSNIIEARNSSNSQILTLVNSGRVNITGSLGITGGITGSLQGTASYAISASYASIPFANITLLPAALQGNNDDGVSKVDKTTLTSGTSISASALVNGTFYNAEASSGGVDITLNAVTNIGFEFTVFATNLTNDITFFSASAGITIISEDGNLKLNKQGSAAVAKYIDSNIWALVGSLKA